MGIGASVFLATQPVIAGESSDLIRIGLGDGLSSNPRAEPVQWIMVPRNTGLKGFFKSIGGQPTGVSDFAAFLAAPPYALFLQRKDRAIFLALIRDNEKIEYKEKVPGGVFMDGDVLSLRPTEPGIERAKVLDKNKRPGVPGPTPAHKHGVRWQSEVRTPTPLWLGCGTA